MLANNIVTSSLPAQEISDQSISEFLLKKLEKLEDTTVLLDCDKDKRWTGRQLYSASINLSAALVEQVGVRPDDVVLYVVPNSDVSAIAILAAWTAGGIVCCASEKLKSEITKIVTVIKPSLIVCCPASLASCRDAIDKNSKIKLFLMENVKEKDNTFNQLPTIESLINYQQNNNVSLPVARQPSDPASLMLTSGTTGYPKAVIRTNRNLVSFAYAINHPELLEYKQNNCDVVMASPLNHMSGIFLLIHGIVSGATIAVMANEVWQDEFFNNVEKYRITSTVLVPPKLYHMVKNYNEIVEKYDLSSLQNIIYGGLTLAESIYNEVKEKYKFKKFRNAFGSTEIGWATQVHLNKQEKNRLTAGKPVPGSEVKIISPENPNLALPANQTGELCIRGPQVSPGYYNHPQAIKENILSEGFFRTGDLGYYDETGQIFIVGRIKEIMKIGQSNIAPSEIETVLLSHPDVLEATVVGIEHESGDIPVGFVVKRESSSHVSEKDLVDFVADRVHPIRRLTGGVRFVEQLPKSPLGKVKREQLKMLLIHK